MPRKVIVVCVVWGAAEWRCVYDVVVVVVNVVLVVIVVLVAVLLIYFWTRSCRISW